MPRGGGAATLAETHLTPSNRGPSHDMAATKAAIYFALCPILAIFAIV